MSDRAVSQFQDNASVVFDALANAEILNSVFVDVTFLSAKPETTVAHGLGRPARGWICVKTDQPIVTYLSASDTGAKNMLILNANILNPAATVVKTTLFIF